jgi:hypothetical protein
MVGGEVGAAEFPSFGTCLQTGGSQPEAKVQRYAIPAAAVFTMREGRFCHVTSYSNLRKGLEALG